MSISATDADPLSARSDEAVNAGTVDLELDLARARAEVAELTALIRHIDVAAQTARRQRDQAVAELAELRQSMAGQAALVAKRSLERALPNGSTGRSLCRQVGQRVRHTIAGIRKVST